ncbi:carbon-nitrogen hydrolase family protein [Xanthobacter tagetidis]|jgi:predicted amidohydrolase|uniref:Carbon-nitrogen hydrolase family protein n=1 Tax=Xanthobacter tagetidis TaxID=60216 RepID=A0A3L7AR33_9HYPH|nr:carbon-nitrogen hydrolase family protein [Xanthobacter tagetidis]MBB6308258.1 putative amidohydrolase [Xanthobacter tagetidis]RLP81868.1 carbon-nitrogen hydrolase family protein [Xanthobacter tagetidis]
MTSSDTPPTLRVGLVQMRSGREAGANLEAARALVREAARDGAQYVQTPETTNLMELDRALLFDKLAAEEDDITLAALRETARELKIHLHIGSLALKVSENRAVNRAFLIDPEGEITARYDKIHMFDVDLGNGESYRESTAYRPGERAVVAEVGAVPLGLTICYDLRFPALYRALAEAGAKVLTVPAAFTRPTGEAHWQVLLRARAIENGAYVLAAAQGGRHENGRETYGHSLIVDPWGRVIAEGGTDPGIILAEIDLAEVASARARIPSLTHGRRFEVAGPGQAGHLHVVGASS